MLERGPALPFLEFLDSLACFFARILLVILEMWGLGRVAKSLRFLWLRLL